MGTNRNNKMLGYNRSDRAIKNKTKQQVTRKKNWNLVKKESSSTKKRKTKQGQQRLQENTS